MENILKALDQARCESPKVESHNSAVFVEKLVNDGVAYTQTHVIKPNADFLRSKRVISGLEPGAETDAYRLLRTQVLQRMREQNWRALAITSPTHYAGKNLTAINLAISIAMEVNQTVLLVDFDLRFPDIHNYFDYKPDYGISDYLKTETPLYEILFNPSIERLVVLPGREIFAHSSEMLSSPTMVSLVDELKKRYPNRLVLFNLPPILKADDALAFSPHVDAALMVVEEGETTTDDLTQAMEIMQSVNIIGTVLNKSNN